MSSSIDKLESADSSAAESTSRANGSHAPDALAREVAELRVLRDALTQAERSESLEGRLRATAVAVERLGFAAGAVIVMTPTGTTGLGVMKDGAGPALEMIVRKARLASLDAPMDNSCPALAFPLAVGGGLPLARLVVVRPDGGYPAGREESLRLLGAQAARAIDDARIVNVAERRAARLQRLQEVGVLLSRLLDEPRIIRELARHIQRVVQVRGVVIAQPDVENGTVDIALHVEGSTSRPRGREPLAPGIIADVARSGRITRVAADKHEEIRAAIGSLVGGDATGIGAVLAVPMLSQHRLVGVVAVYADASGAFNTEDEELLATIAAQAAAAIVNARLFEESQRERRQSEALAEIARAVGGSLRVSEVLQLIQRHAIALFGTRGAMVAIRKGKFLHVVAAMGSGEVLAGMFLPVEGSVSGRALLSAHPVITNDIRNAPEVYAPARDLMAIERSLMAPLISNEGPVGVLAVLDREQPFDSDDAVILQRFADQVAIAFVNARLYEEAADANRELAATFDVIAEGLVMVDSAGVIQRCNPRAAELLGAREAKDVVGTEFAAALLGSAHADATPVTRAMTEQTVQRGTLRHVERGVIYDLAAAPHPAGGAVVLFDDVTSSFDLADRFRALTEHASDAWCTLDATDMIRAANEAAHAIFGRAPGEMVGLTLPQLASPADADDVRAHLRAASQGQPEPFEFGAATRDGTPIRVRLAATPVRERTGAVALFAVMRDVS